MADLTINQLLQENVPEGERGAIGGVQSALNRVMDLLKFVLVLILPRPETFGVLIILSVVFVFMGDCFFAFYSYRTRGHLLPHCSRNSTNNCERPVVDEVVDGRFEITKL